MMKAKENFDDVFPFHDPKMADIKIRDHVLKLFCEERIEILEYKFHWSCMNYFSWVIFIENKLQKNHKKQSQLFPLFMFLVANFLSYIQDKHWKSFT